MQHPPPPGWPPPPHGQPQAYGQPQPYGQQPPAYGQQPPHGYGQPPAYGHGAPPGFGAPVRSVGLFERIPCPHCQTPTTSHAAGAATAQWAGGLVGWLIVSAISSKHYCVHHGEIPKNAFPPAHQSAMTTRMIVKLGGSVVLLFVVFALVILSAILQG